MTTATLAGSLPPEANGTAASQVRVQFSTKEADIRLPDNTGPILVPTNLRRYGLSTLVNHLLSTPKPTPFDFLINGAFLRTSIDDYLAANGISTESAITLEYVRSILPPLHLTSYEHDDWVSSVDVLSSSSAAGQWQGGSGDSLKGQERILSGSYDGLLRVWDTSAQLLATSTSADQGGHTSSIKCAKFMSPSRIVSAGHDRSVRVWKLSQETDGSSLLPSLELYGHHGGIESLAVHEPSSRILSASTDHTVGMWTTQKSTAPPAASTLVPSHTPSSKRRKITPSGGTQIAQRGPLSLMRGHTAPVSSTMFAPHDSTVAYSVSRDHSLRTWDLVTSALVDTRTLAHALLSLTVLPELNLVAAGTSARHISLIDPRASATSTAKMTLRGHSNAVVSVAPDPTNTYGLVSGSHDGTCRVWDVRSRKGGVGRAEGMGMAGEGGVVGESVYTIEREGRKGKGARVGGEGIKVFGVAWDREVGIVSGGEDKRLQINRARADERGS